jgi:hypothetical protein
MKLELQKKLKRLYDKDYRIIIHSYDSPDPYILGILEIDGQIYYHDSRMYGLPLGKVKESVIEVFKPIEKWQEVKLED